LQVQKTCDRSKKTQNTVSMIGFSLKKS